MQLEILRCLGYGPKALTYKATMHRLKSMFSQLTPVSNNLVLTSYLSGIHIIMVFMVMGKSAENIEEKKKTDRRKKLKS